MLEELLAFYAVKIGLVATILLFFFVLVALILQIQKEQYAKKYLFLAILLTTFLPTLYFISSTIYLNTVSVSKGPVHWHADIEVWACGEELELRDPKGFSNKIGTAVLHEHNDKRIHQEGVVVHMSDVSLAKFFSVIGGSLNSTTLLVPTNTGQRTFTNGQSCPDGTQGSVQVFRYGVENGTYFQEKLADPASFVMAPHSAVPDGDCIIVEFGQPKDRTDKLCRSYKVAESLDKIRKEPNGR
jgi:hypothetical protein